MYDDMHGDMDGDGDNDMYGDDHMRGDMYGDMYGDDHGDGDMHNHDLAGESFDTSRTDEAAKSDRKPVHRTYLPNRQFEKRKFGRRTADGMRRALGAGRRADESKAEQDRSCQGGVPSNLRRPRLRKSMARGSKRTARFGQLGFDKSRTTFDKTDCAERVLTFADFAENKS